MKKTLFLSVILLLTLTFLFSCAGQADNSTASSTTVSTAPDTQAQTSKPQTDSEVSSSDGNTSQITTPPQTTPLQTTPVTTEPYYPDITYNTEKIEQAVGEPLLINWNPYLTSNIFSYMGEEYNEGKNMLITALLNHRSSLEFSSREVMEAVCENIFFEFPPSALASFSYSDGSTVNISYLYKRDEHLAKTDEFKRELEALISETLVCGDSDAVNAILLYKAVTDRVDYCSSAYPKWQIGAYGALICKETICYGFADLYCHLLRQVGIEANLVIGKRESDSAEHAWAFVKLDGEYYHCDPTWENSTFDGAGFEYFGMNSAKRSKNFKLSSCTLGKGTLQYNFLDRYGSSNLTDSERFSALNKAYIKKRSWTLDKETNTIIYEGVKYSF